MKIKLVMTAVVAAIAGFSASVQANPITGSISFTGGSTLNGSLASATQITGYSSLSVLGGAETGTYAPLDAGGMNTQNGISALSFSPFGFALNVLNPNPVLLWTVTFGGNVYSFAATSVDINVQNAFFLNLTGTGTAYLNGVDATSGTWSITDTGGTPTFTFGASTSIPTVPDGGMTVSLLGLALGCCVLFARKMKKLA